MRTNNIAFGTYLCSSGNVFQNNAIQKGFRQAAKKLNANKSRDFCNLIADETDVYMQKSLSKRMDSLALGKPYRQISLDEFKNKDETGVKAFIIDSFNALNKV